MALPPRTALVFGVVTVAVSVAAGCAAVLGLRDAEDGDTDASIADGGDGDSADATVADVLDNPDDGPPSPPVDASGVDAGGVECSPTKTFIPKTGAQGTVCNIANVLPGATGVAGLDFINNVQASANIGDKLVTSCLGVTFAVPPKTVIITAAAVAKACDRSCSDYAGLKNCGTGHTALIFGGDENGPFEKLDVLGLGPTQQEFRVTPGASQPRSIIVCRAGWSGERDDVAVSSIRGICP